MKGVANKYQQVSHDDSRAGARAKSIECENGETEQDINGKSKQRP